MDCPNCGTPYAYIIRTHYVTSDGERLKRTRRCTQCGHEFETVELLASELRRLTFRDTLNKVVNGKGENHD